MDDAHAAQPRAVRQANELAQRLARFVAAQAVQVELALDAPAARAQLARYVLANAGAAKAQLIVHIQQGAHVELVTHGLVQHALLVLQALQRQRFGGAGWRQVAVVCSAAFQWLHGAHGVREQVALALGALLRLALCLGLRRLLGRSFLQCAAQRAQLGQAVRFDSQTHGWLRGAEQRPSPSPMPW